MGTLSKRLDGPVISTKKPLPEDTLPDSQTIRRVYSQFSDAALDVFISEFQKIKSRRKKILSAPSLQAFLLLASPFFAF